MRVHSCFECVVLYFVWLFFEAWGELANGLCSFNGCVITDKAANMLFYAFIVNSVRQICGNNC